MDLLLAGSYVVHVGSALLWVGAVGYVAYTAVPGGVADHLDTGGVELLLDRLLRVTRWTGVALPLTGLYQVWVLYPLDRLFGTTRGHLVLGMALLWGVMNGLVEVGVLRARAVVGERPAFGTYMAEGVAADGGLPAGTGARALAAVRPYLLGATGLGVLLAVDAALLAGGLAALAV
jgi:hypothetical protein